MTVPFEVRLGTRGSDLALSQTALVEQALLNKQPALKIERKIIKTSGDNSKTVDPRAGWKGIFTAEIERALISGEIDVAIHSAKDLPSTMSSGAEIGAVLPRAATHDVLISKHTGGLDGLPRGAIVATSSVRRQCQMRWKRPDVSIVDVRGNVPTRLRKLVENDWDAIVLARAGLERLGISLSQFCIEELPEEFFVPAGGQGVIAIQVRVHDDRVKSIVHSINDLDILLCLEAEREFLRLLDVDCNAPVGALAKIENGMMTMRGQFFQSKAGPPRY